MLPLDLIAKMRSRLDELRTGLGRTGDFPFFSQVAAPATAEAARSLVQSYAAVGVSSLIVSEGATISGIPFMEREEAVRALLESAHSAPEHAPRP
jgi:hypothetical protein